MLLYLSIIKKAQCIISAMENADLVIRLDLSKRRTKVINGKTAENGLRVDVLREIETKARDNKQRKI